MNISLAEEVYLRASSFPWFRHCGESVTSETGLSFQRPLGLTDAMYQMQSDGWNDAKTHAQGELTGYLSRQDYSTYSNNWNKLAREAELSNKKIALNISNGLVMNGFEKQLLQIVLVDMGRAALEISFRKKFKNAPDFFERLLQVYESGHLPCGWSGEIELWPEGQLIIF